MTIAQIMSWINQDSRFKLTPAQLLLIVDIVNKLSCDEDLDAFLSWDNTITVLTEITLDTGFTDFETTDVGLTLEGATSGATGVVVSYDNDDGTVVLSDVSGTFEADEAVEVDGGDGDGTVDTVLGYKGPYSYPTSPPVRKMKGVTLVSDAYIFGTASVYISDQDDYGMPIGDYDARKFYRPGRLDRIAKTFTFSTAPSLTSTDPYRWVYYRKPETISSSTGQDDHILIPEEYHMNFIQACIKAADVTTRGGIMTRDDVMMHFFDWWKTLRSNYTPNGKASNQVNEGCIP